MGMNGNWQPINNHNNNNNNPDDDNNDNSSNNLEYIWMLYMQTFQFEDPFSYSGSCNRNSIF